MAPCQTIADFMEAEMPLPSPEVVEERAAARRLFLLQSLVVDPGEHAKGRASFERVMELGGKRAKAMSFATIGQALVSRPLSDKQFRELQVKVTRRYLTARAFYEEREGIVRSGLMLMGRAMLEVFLESNPCASKEAQLLHMEELSRCLHTEESGAVSHCPRPRPRVS